MRLVEIELQDLLCKVYRFFYSYLYSEPRFLNLIVKKLNFEPNFKNFIVGLIIVTVFLIQSHGNIFQGGILRHMGVNIFLQKYQ